MSFLGFIWIREAWLSHRWVFLLLMWGCLPLAAQSAEVLNTSVVRQQGRFILHSETLVRATVSAVRRIFSDYKNLHRINPNIKRVEVLERFKDGTVRMGVSSDFCVLKICLNFVWVQDVRSRTDIDIGIAIVPDRGDFREGSGRWRLLPDAGGTRLMFDIDLTPNFWIPPVFGSWLMKRQLAEEAFETARGLERIVMGGSDHS